MVPVSEKLHTKRLNDFNLVIEDRFLKQKYPKDEILVRATDLLRDDSVIGCQRIEKVYFLNGKCIYVEKDFEPTIRYTYLVDRKNEKEIDCPSCGYHGKSTEFSLGCPYCNTNYCVEFSDRTRHSVTKFLSFKAIRKIFLISYISVLLLELMVMEEDILVMLFVNLMISAYITVGCMVIYCVFHIIRPPQSYDIGFRKLIQKGFVRNESRIYNDLYVELNNYFYNDSKNSNDKYLIDYDIPKYNKVEYQIEFDDTKSTYKEYLILSFNIRKYYFINNEIQKVEEVTKAKLVRNQNVINTGKDIKCRNCGASYDLDFRVCEYCGTVNDSKCEWHLDSFVA